MTSELKALKIKLDNEAFSRNSNFELSQNASSDPMQIATLYKDEFISLICALFAYGNAKNIVKFLKSLDFSLLDKEEKTIQKEFKNHKYRFQTSADIREFFISLRRLKQEQSLNEIFVQAYKKNHNVMDGINLLIKKIYEINPYMSNGYKFLIGSTFAKNPLSPYKRWNMYLRWMVRQDEIDLGLWKGVDKADLLIPLDTHTHKTALKLGLLKRKSYDFKAVVELTKNLREFDEQDPVKYDFALYRMGQEKLI